MSAPGRDLIWTADGDHAGGRHLSKPVVYGLLAYAIVILGANWPIMATGLRSITPIWMAAFRTGGAAILVGAVGAATGKVIVPPRRDLPIIASVAVFRLALLMTLVFFALRLLPAGRASVLVWTSALWTVPIAGIVLGEKVSRPKWIGLLVGLTGVVVISELWNNDWRERDVLVGTGLLLAGALVNASTAVHIRRHRWTMTPSQALPWQLGIASILLTLLALIVDGVPSIEWTPQLTLIVLYQAGLASGTAFWAQIAVLRNLSAVSTNLSMMGIPVIGVVSSIIVLDEQITWALTLGMALVIAGVSINILSDRRTGDRRLQNQI